MKVLLDLNVLMDFLLARIPWNVEADALWDAHLDGRCTLLVSAASLPTAFYLAQRAGGEQFAFKGIRLTVATVKIIAVDANHVESALAMLGRDFKDNLQIACAIENRADVIVTRNTQDFVASPITVMTPTELLATLP